MGRFQVGDVVIVKDVDLSCVTAHGVKVPSDIYVTSLDRHKGRPYEILRATNSIKGRRVYRLSAGWWFDEEHLELPPIEVDDWAGDDVDVAALL